jgi:hypothetical protein
MRVGVVGRETFTPALLQFLFWALLAFPGSAKPATSHGAVSAPYLNSGQKEPSRNPHGLLNIPCENCHTAAGWRPIRSVPEFDHNKTKYPLRGMHENVKCSLCHVKPVFTDVGKTCADCHRDIHNRQLGPNCEQCHTVQGWKVATQQVKDHQNRFPLLGGHSAVQCQDCHKSAASGIFYGLSTDCQSCHLRDWQNTSNPPHASNPSAFPVSACKDCHTSFDSWLGATFMGNHAAPPISFPLTGGHANVPCEACHVNNNFHLQIAATDCGNGGCHLTTWQRTNNPAHSTAGTPFAVGNCSQCHDTIAWTDLTSFNHSVTGFTLTGSHTTTPCVQCHVNNNYTLQIAPTDCGNSSCHLKQWNSTETMGASVPNHVTAGFPISQCSTCHNTTSWADATFNHNSTGFPLTNSHQMAPAGKMTACAQCHINNNYNLQIAPTDCGNAGCHLTTWQQTNNPTHSTSGGAFAAANCATCHDTVAWTDNSFNHSVTGFTLVGTHVSPTPTPCVSCHISNNYNLTSTDCMSCHKSAWSSTQTIGGNAPNHVAANFPTTASACSTCHSVTVWANGVFNHSATGFPLTNSHQMAPAGKVTQCTQCHISGNYTLQILPTDCGNAGCHLTTWQQTNNPTHTSAGSAFTTSNCSNCHDTITWTDNTFNHASTGWPLTGNHQMQPAGVMQNCTQCHVGNNYNLTVKDCYNSGCHTKDWNSTATIGGVVPNHIAANFPTSLCSTCHDTVLWADGKFNHSTTGWALTGGHVVPTPGGVQACTDCHISNNYSLTSANTACYGCHMAQWNSTQTLGGSVPNHIAAGYPTTCDACHSTSSWLGAVFNHTYFPIPHHGSVCNDCHQVSSNYASFTCINCHTTTAHQQTQTNDTHQGIGGYSYGPTTCYTCHKNGGGG